MISYGCRNGACGTCKGTVLAGKVDYGTYQESALTEAEKRLGLAQAWRILVVVELLAAVPWGLGWLIFGAREFLNTDVMLAGIVVIGAIGLVLENLVFRRLEQITVVRWGMMAA